jgi:hypothetical protein
MAAPVGLQQLVEAITRSIVEAQDKVELHQLASLLKYIDEDQRPKMFSMTVPSMSHGSDEDVSLKVPWLALIKPNLLAIKSLQVDMEVGLAEFASDAGTPSPAPGKKSDGLPTPPSSGTLQLDVTALPQSSKQNTAKIVLNVEGQEPSEGLTRMILELVKRIRTDKEQE